MTHTRRCPALGEESGRLSWVGMRASSREIAKRTLVLRRRVDHLLLVITSLIFDVSCKCHAPFLYSLLFETGHASPSSAQRSIASALAARGQRPLALINIPIPDRPSMESNLLLWRRYGSRDFLSWIHVL